MSEADSARPSPLRGRNGPSEGSSRGAIACARARSSASAELGAPASSVSSSVEVWRISRCSGVAAASRRALMSASASATLWPAGRCSSADELQQLQVAHDAVGDVEVGVQAQLAEAPADARDAREHLLAQHAAASRCSCARARHCVARPASADAVARRDPASSRRRATTRAQQVAGARRVERLAPRRRGAARRKRWIALARLGRDLRRLDRRAERRDRCRACAGARPGSRAPGRPGAARSAGARARARPRRHPADRPAGASRRARRAPRRAPGRPPPSCLAQRRRRGGAGADLEAGTDLRIRASRAGRPRRARRSTSARAPAM